MAIHWTQIAVAAALVIYPGAFAIILAFINRRSGVSPVGHDGGHRLAATLNKVATLLLLIPTVAYALNARSAWIGLDADAIQRAVAEVPGVTSQNVKVIGFALSDELTAWLKQGLEDRQNKSKEQAGKSHTESNPTVKEEKK
jgi:hypothetical protein